MKIMAKIYYWMRRNHFLLSALIPLIIGFLVACFLHIARWFR